MAYDDLNEILNVLRKQKKHLEKKYKIQEIGVFGSFVRGDHNPGSDLDILVNYKDNTIDLFDFLDLKEYLSSLIPMEVDLVMKDGLKPGIGKDILKEVVYA
jgi:predicted nucleotidyltransferase